MENEFPSKPGMDGSGTVDMYEHEAGAILEALAKSDPDGFGCGMLVLSTDDEQQLGEGIEMVASGQGRSMAPGEMG